MKIAYADPPYLGQGKLYRDDHTDSDIWDNPQTYVDLIARLADEYPDGWALSASSQSLRTILPLCPEDVRVMAWVKPFASFKKNVNPAYAWEPILVMGGRPRTDKMTYMRDWCAESITLKKGLTGAKPENVCYWLFDALNLQPEDTLDDLFPGTNIVTESWKRYSEDYEEYASKINRVQYKWEMGKGAIR